LIKASRDPARAKWTRHHGGWDKSGRAVAEAPSQRRPQGQDRNCNRPVHPQPVLSTYWLRMAICYSASTVIPQSNPKRTRLRVGLRSVTP